MMSFNLVTLFAALVTGQQVINDTRGPGYHVLSNDGGAPDLLIVRRNQLPKKIDQAYRLNLWDHFETFTSVSC